MSNDKWRPKYLMIQTSIAKRSHATFPGKEKEKQKALDNAYASKHILLPIVLHTQLCQSDNMDLLRY